MYDYLSIYSPGYSKTIRTEVLEEYLKFFLNFNKESSLRFSKIHSGELIRVTGILANSKGNYAFNSLDGIEEINLIEIDIPENINDELEKTILNIAKSIAKEYSWLIDLGGI
ncbi:hypothetical protein [Chengkuizengella axinellae]|uniref:IDEAL domain-containing protein n=1 Tax=Chengkuizengella axinellae TaxID=3064388 RepID=A0ABT9J3K2_9BACL|nr:hypothetical protein [Chengkuizengella sp. 2205SS18-9]MDP5276186.1 hypothetical protein [Chengkuizengella sp. 2205SS18-9]